MDSKFFALSKYEAKMIWDSFSGAQKDVLLQLRKVTWDGNISSKTGRDELISDGYAIRYEGFSVVSNQGLILLERIGKLEEFNRQ